MCILCHVEYLSKKSRYNRNCKDKCFPITNRKEVSYAEKSHLPPCRRRHPGRRSQQPALRRKQRPCPASPHLWRLHAGNTPIPVSSAADLLIHRPRPVRLSRKKLYRQPVCNSHHKEWVHRSEGPQNPPGQTKISPVTGRLFQIHFPKRRIKIPKISAFPVPFIFVRKIKVPVKSLYRKGAKIWIRYLKSSEVNQEIATS